MIFGSDKDYRFVKEYEEEKMLLQEKLNKWESEMKEVLENFKKTRELLIQQAINEGYSQEEIDAILKEVEK